MSDAPASRPPVVPTVGSRGAALRSTIAASGSTLGLGLLAVLVALILTSPVILIAGASPIDAYANFFLVPLTSQFRLLEVLVAATPLILTGIAVAVAFRGGYWNIGAEGQLLLGAIAATGWGSPSPRTGPRSSSSP